MSSGSGEGAWLELSNSNYGNTNIFVIKAQCAILNERFAAGINLTLHLYLPDLWLYHIRAFHGHFRSLMSMSNKHVAKKSL